MSTVRWTFLLLLLCCVPTGWAQTLGSSKDGVSPRAVIGLDLDQRLNEQLPLEVAFTNHEGQARRIGDVFDGSVPVLLTFNYSTCPMLCSTQLNSLVTAMRGMKLRLGRDFRILTISLDHEEKVSAAKSQHTKYLTDLAQADAVASGWQFYVGGRAEIDRAAEAAGFPFRYLPDLGEYSHRPIFVFCTPEGRISRYFEGVGNRLKPRDIRLTLVEAGNGQIGTLVDEIFLTCFLFDPEAGSWTMNALNMMSIGGGFTLLVLGIVLLRWWRRDLRIDRKTLAAEGAAS